MQLNYKIINDKVLEVFTTCEIKKFPVDCIEVLQHYRFRLFTYSEIKLSDPELYAIAKEYSDDAFKYGNIICYNTSGPEGRVRFSLMHELGHFILNHQETTQENEDEADYFASCILAPRVAIHKTLCRTADAIHDTFGLSYAASNRALADFKKWHGRRKYDSEHQLIDYLYPKNVVAERAPLRTAPVHKKYPYEWRELKRKHRFIEENICDLEEYAFRERERQIFNGI